jgi:E3 ubiquitin-protein ligase listerin
MSKRQFKSQASSSRAASGAGFGGFGSISTGSTLSYLTELPNLSAITDANVVVGFKNLTKKDGTTKSKALEDLRVYVQAHPFEQRGGTEEAVLEAWVRHPCLGLVVYNRIVIKNLRSNSILVSLLIILVGFANFPITYNSSFSSQPGSGWRSTYRR